MGSSTLERRLADDSTPKAIATVAMAVIDRVQNYPKVDRAVGMAASFILLCERLGVSPRSALTVAENVMKGARYRSENSFAAVRMFLEKEVD